MELSHSGSNPNRLREWSALGNAVAKNTRLDKFCNDRGVYPYRRYPNMGRALRRKVPGAGRTATNWPATPLPEHVLKKRERSGVHRVPVAQDDRRRSHMVGRLHQWLAIAKGLWPKLTAHRATKSNRSLTATPANFGERWRTLA